MEIHLYNLYFLVFSMSVKNIVLATGCDNPPLDGIISRDYTLNNLRGQQWMPRQQTIELNSCTPPIEKIENNAFSQINVTVVSLSLRNNSLNDIQQGMFDGLRNLTIMDLSWNFIDNIVDRTFENTPRLQRLYLNNNKLTSITYKTFYGLNELEVLTLHANKIFLLGADTFFPLRKLQHLDISQNSLGHLTRGVFSPLINLVTLHVARNHLKQLEIVDFFSLAKLRILKLDNNQIEQITDNAFGHLNELEHLHLNNNNIREITSSTFVGLERLEHLFLQENRIDRISDNAFNGMPNLEILNLSSNSLKDLGLNLNGLTRLRQLDVTNNSVSNLPYFSTKGTSKGPTGLYTTRSKSTDTTTIFPDKTTVAPSGAIADSTIALIVGIVCAGVAVLIVLITMCIICKGLKANKTMVITRHKQMRYLNQLIYLPKNNTEVEEDAQTMEKTPAANANGVRPENVAVVSGVMRNGSNASELYECGSGHLVRPFQSNYQPRPLEVVVNDADSQHDDARNKAGDEDIGHNDKVFSENNGIGVNKNQYRQSDDDIPMAVETDEVDRGSNQLVSALNRMSGQEHMDISLPPTVLSSNESLAADDISPYATFQFGENRGRSVETTQL